MKSRAIIWTDDLDDQVMTVFNVLPESRTVPILLGFVHEAAINFG